MDKNCQSVGSKVHKLSKTSESMCIHTYLIYKANLDDFQDKKKTSDRQFEIDRVKTIEIVINDILQHFPKATEDPCRFLKLNSDFISDLRKAIIDWLCFFGQT